MFIVSEKQFFVTGDISINSLNYQSSNIIKNFFNVLLKNGIFPVITRPTRTTRRNSTVINHLLRNANLIKKMSCQIVNTDFQINFLFFSYTDEEIVFNSKGEETIFKRKINDQSILTFKNILSNCNWEALYSENCAEIAYNKLLKIWSKSYDTTFPEIQIKVHTKTLLSAWITEGIQKSLRKKQKLYKKFLKKQSYNFENTKNVFKKI